MLVVLFLSACVATVEDREADHPQFTIVGEPAVFAPGIASTEFAEIRLTISPDGGTALWFSRDRPGGSGGFDIWMSRQGPEGWRAVSPVSFNSPGRDFDPAFTADGGFVYFASDRAGGLGGDDIWRVAVVGETFGTPTHLGREVNSSGNEWAPMLSPDGRTLLFSSNGREGARRFDLYRAVQENGVFRNAEALPGQVNTAADEFDATFLAEDGHIVFSRAADLQADRVDLFYATHRNGRYDAGLTLGQPVNSATEDTYGPMLDWSHPDRLTFSGRRDERRNVDLYLVRYRRGL
jgi:Tol biopolymer transport system component